MRLSTEGLRAEAGQSGFRPEVLEKVHRLLDVLDGMRRHPYLKSRIALKGGTALNLLVFDVPRLSVDIDLNYIGALDRETTLGERPHTPGAPSATAGWARSPHRRGCRSCATGNGHFGTSSPAAPALRRQASPAHGPGRHLHVFAGEYRGRKSRLTLP